MRNHDIDALDISDRIVIDYYSDVLCVWAWIAQRRIEELTIRLGNKIELRYHYIEIFGDTKTKIQTQWAGRGLYEGFANHVLESSAGFEDVQVNPALWSQVRPTTSANAHIMLKAVEICHGKALAIDMAFQFRQAFFIDAIDISNLSILSELIKQPGIHQDRILDAINNGSAIAALMADHQKSKQLAIKGSPTYVMDNGRQILYGNVGYRVLHANIEELLRNPSDEASWC